jgi:hypothetical protein
MRVVVVSSILFFIACGGSKKPAESAESPAESTTSTSDMPAASESTSESPALGSTPAASAAPAPTAAPAPAAESAAAHPVPTSTGGVDGKPFVPKMARVTQPAAKDGRIVLTLDERTDCGGGDPKPGETFLTLTVPWEDGYKQDLGSLKRAGKKGPGEIAFVRVNTNGKREPSETFKPTGRVTVVKAPTEEGATGKLKVDMQSGDYMLAGDLDIQMCVAPKGGAGGGAAAAPKAAPKAGKKKKN